MVKASSGHGLDRKYKPWRRGKSEKTKGKKGSLKQQLRGLQRLLPKAKDDAHRQQIEQQIAGLQDQIAANQKVEQQKTNARRSHGVRFLERQRLTRAWSQADKLPDQAARQAEQYRIGLDMLYVAHYPLQTRYQPLFRNNQRILLDGRNLARRAAARGKILQQVHAAADQPVVPRVHWIPAAVYDNCPRTWSNQHERDTFGVIAPSTPQAASDDRFLTVPDSHAALAQAAQALDAALDAQEAVHSDNGEKKVATEANAVHSSDKSSSSSEGMVNSDDEDEDNADPLHEPTVQQAVGNVTHHHDEAVNNSDDDSSSDNSSSSSSSSSSSDDDSSDKEEGGEDSTKSPAKSSSIQHQKPPPIEDDDDDDDDFLVADTADHAADIFAHAKEQVPSLDTARGDKSQGWATQRQRPGQFKKRRTRR